MANKILKWNCRGLKANFNELLLLLAGLCPSVVCLQETFLKHSDNLNIKGYTLYNHIHPNGDRASGGSSVVINNCIPQSQIPIYKLLLSKQPYIKLFIYAPFIYHQTIQLTFLI